MKPNFRNILSGLFSFLLFVSLPGCGGGDDNGINSDVDVDALTAQLDSSDENVVIEALGNLWQAEDRLLPTLPKLIELLKHTNPEVRQLASYNIYVIGEDAKAAIEPIKELVKTERDTNARLQHANTWNSIDPDNATPLGQN
jgi:HEAT repeat protein